MNSATQNALIQAKEDGRFVRLTLCRPRVNVLNIAMMRSINEYLTSLTSRGNLCALLIDAEGQGAFVEKRLPVWKD